MTAIGNTLRLRPGQGPETQPNLGQVLNRVIFLWVYLFPVHQFRCHDEHDNSHAQQVRDPHLAQMSSACSNKHSCGPLIPDCGYVESLGDKKSPSNSPKLLSFAAFYLFPLRYDDIIRIWYLASAK